VTRAQGRMGGCGTSSVGGRGVKVFRGRTEQLRDRLCGPTISPTAAVLKTLQQVRPRQTFRALHHTSLYLCIITVPIYGLMCEQKPLRPFLCFYNPR